MTDCCYPELNGKVANDGKRETLYAGCIVLYKTRFIEMFLHYGVPICCGSVHNIETIGRHL
jgi:hypothetical protein